MDVLRQGMSVVVGGEEVSADWEVDVESGERLECKDICIKGLNHLPSGSEGAATTAQRKATTTISNTSLFRIRHKEANLANRIFCMMIRVVN